MDITFANAPVNEELDRAVCFKKVESELLAIPDDELTQINLDVPSCVITGLGCLPKVMALRKRITEALVEFDIKNLDCLEDYTLALGYAHSQFMITSESTDDLHPLSLEGAESRDRLHADVKALCVRHVINPDALRSFKGLNGYRNIAADLLLLVAILNENWQTIEGHCMIEKSELERASKVSLHMLRLVGLREQHPAAIAESALVRTRAFTAFTHAYSQVRRAVAYLRWDQGDADKIAPSLYANRIHKHEEVPVELPAPSPVAGSSTSSSSPASSPAPLESGKPAGGLKVPVPGSNPFMD